MSSWFRGVSLAVFATLVALTPTLAAPAPAAGAQNAPLALAAPAAASLPATAAAPDYTSLQLKPVQTARVPFETAWNTTILAANSQAMGLQVARRSQASPTRLAIAGAAIGAIVGAVAGDPLSDAAIGGIAGFGIGYMIRR